MLKAQSVTFRPSSVGYLTCQASRCLSWHVANCLKLDLSSRLKICALYEQNRDCRREGGFDSISDLYKHVNKDRPLLSPDIYLKRWAVLPKERRVGVRKAINRAHHIGWASLDERDLSAIFRKLMRQVKAGRAGANNGAAFALRIVSQQILTATSILYIDLP